MIKQFVNLTRAGNRSAWIRQPDPREKVGAAVAPVEACEWDMDHAVQQLHKALRDGVGQGSGG